MTYIKEDGKIYEVRQVKKEVDLEALKKELASRVEIQKQVDLLQTWKSSLSEDKQSLVHIPPAPETKELEAFITTVETK